MGASVWLYGWLVLRQTHQSGELGWVLGGSPVSYREIEEETGFNRRTLERWMRTLRRHGYIETSAVPSGVVIRITKAKKFAESGSFSRGRGDGRNPAHTARRAAEGPAQASVASIAQTLSPEKVAPPMCSSSVDGYIKRKESTEIHRDFHNPFHILFHSPPSGNSETNPKQNRGQHQETSCLNEPQTQTEQNQMHNPISTHPRYVRREPLPEGREYTQREFFAEARRRVELLRAKQGEDALRQELAREENPEERRR